MITIPDTHAGVLSSECNSNTEKNRPEGKNTLQPQVLESVDIEHKCM